MRLIFSALFFIFSLLEVGPARASSARSCDLIKTLVALPVDLEKVRHGRLNAVEFQRNLAATLKAFGNPTRTDVFSREELRAMRIFAGTVRKDWKLNGTSPNGRQIPGLTKTSATIDNQLAAIVTKFGCEERNAASGTGLWATGDAAISPLSLLLSVFSLVFAALGIYRLVWLRYQVRRRLCHVPAQLHHENTAALTDIVDISRNGAKIKAVEELLVNNVVTLEVAGHSVGARVVWLNSNFIGLQFDRMLPQSAVDEIADAEAVSASEGPENAVSTDPGAALARVGQVRPGMG